MRASTRHPALLTLLLSLLLLSLLGAPAAQAEPLDKAQPGLLSTSQARQVLATLSVDRDGKNSGYTRDAFYKSWRVVTANKGTGNGVLRWYGWDAYASGTTWSEPDVAKALTPQKGCDAREITLIRDAVNGSARWDASTCEVTGGRWYEDYAGKTTTDPKTLDIEHVVAMQDAWDNGASRWHGDRRLQFSHDPLVLGAVSLSENRAKGSRGPAQWKPSNTKAWPAYAARYISIKHSYDLTLSSEAERTALRQMLDGGAEPAPAGPFKDVRAGQEHYEAMVWMKSAGISTGWSDGTYRPLQPVNRDAMAAFLYRLDGSPRVPLPTSSPFRDVSPRDEHYAAIIWAYQQGITRGWADGTFRPRQAIERDAMAAFLYRYAEEPAYTAPSSSPFRDVRPGQMFHREMAWEVHRHLDRVGRRHLPPRGPGQARRHGGVPPPRRQEVLRPRHRPRLTAAQLRDLVTASTGAYRITRVRRAVALARDRVGSPEETETRLLLLGAGFAEPVRASDADLADPHDLLGRLMHLRAPLGRT